MIAAICKSMESEGFTVFLVETASDAQSFFTQAKKAFPLDPPISGRVHWDAFSDSLWGGLDACKESRVALVVRDITGFRESNKQEYEIAISCLTNTATEVEAEKKSEGYDNAEIVVVVGID